MIFYTTAIKVATILTILLAAGGSSYLLLKSDTKDSEPQPNLKTHVHTHHFHGEEEDGKFHHICDHGNYIKDLELEITLPESESLNMEATLEHETKLRREHKQGNWQPIRIKADYSGFQAGRAQSSFIENKLMRAATGFLSSAYSVYPLRTLKVNRCGNVNVPSEYRNGISGYDLVLFVSASYSQENWLARAGPCQLDGTNYRPTAGSVEFNLKYLNKVDVNNESDKSWYSWITTTIHEVTHVLGFSSGLFPYYVDPSTNRRIGKNNVVRSSNGRDWIIHPKVVDHVKRHFGCQSASGAALENDGGQGTAGSHWERTTFGNEAMTGSDFPDSVFTEFTFSLMESTGWYMPDYKQSEPYNWGKSEGCGIVNGQCQGGAEFCRSQGVDGCSPDATGIAACSSQDFLAPNCGYWRSYGNTDCRRHSSQIDSITKNTGGFVGVGSRCFQTTIPRSVGYQSLPTDCFKATCSNNQIQFQVGNQSYSCSRTGQSVNVSYNSRRGTVTCPEINHFCATEKACPNECSGVGTCRGKTCHCWKGFGGSDCSQQV